MLCCMQFVYEHRLIFYPSLLTKCQSGCLSPFQALQQFPTIALSAQEPWELETKVCHGEIRILQKYNLGLLQEHITRGYPKRRHNSLKKVFPGLVDPILTMGSFELVHPLDLLILLAPMDSITKEESSIRARGRWEPFTSWSGSS